MRDKDRLFAFRVRRNINGEFVLSSRAYRPLTVDPFAKV